MNFSNLVSYCTTSILIIIFSSFVKVSTADTASLSRGWGDTITWLTLDKGLEEAKSSDRPLMLIIHKSWCGACKRLRPLFAQSLEIGERWRKFVMVNVEDDEEPKDAPYSPDGGYVPRILFLDSGGKVDESLSNEGGNSAYKYFYFNADSIVKTMDRALDKYASNTEKEEL